MDETRFIVAGRFIDGSGTAVRKNVFLAVKDRIISDIGPVADMPHDSGVEIHDFSHCSILPALVDCSVSLLQSPSVDSSVRLSAKNAGITEKTAILERHIHYCHVHGVQGVAASDNKSDLVECYPDEIAQESQINIRIAGKQTNSDFLKLYYSDDIDNDETPTQQLKHEELYRILQHKDGKKAVVLANGTQQVREALDAGCDAIEQGYDMGEDNLKEMAKRGVLWIPGVLRAKNALDGAGSGGDVCCRFSLRYVAPGKAIPGAEAFWQKILKEQLAQLTFAKKLGVKTAVGTGAGSVGILHGESMVEEMKLFIKAGYSLEETIRCASENGARFFGMDGLGMLRVGQKATFLITRGTVQQLPRKLAYLEGIYIDGSPSSIYNKTPYKKA